MDANYTETTNTSELCASKLAASPSELTALADILLSRLEDKLMRELLNKLSPHATAKADSPKQRGSQRKAKPLTSYAAKRKQEIISAKAVKPSTSPLKASTLNAVLELVKLNVGSTLTLSKQCGVPQRTVTRISRAVRILESKGIPVSDDWAEVRKQMHRLGENVSSYKIPDGLHKPKGLRY